MSRAHPIAPPGGDEAPAIGRPRRALSRWLDASTRLVVRALPAGLLRSLAQAIGRRDPEILPRAVTIADRGLDLDALPPAVHGFEDLVFLFWHHPMARGALRQDVDEAAALYRHVDRLGARRGVEIGRYAGGSTLLLAAALERSAGKLRSIDVAPRDDSRLETALETLGWGSRVELEVADANQLDPGGPLDFVFIDGDHTYDGARRDHLRWGEAVRVGGLVIHHDMARARPMATGLAPLVRLRRDIEQRQSGELRMVEEVGSLVVFERTSEHWTRFGASTKGNPTKGEQA